METIYCNQCGPPLPPTSRFCNYCGAAVVANSNVNVVRESFAPPQAAAGHAPAPAVRRDDLAPNETVIFVLRPTLIFVFVRYIIATLILLATAALMGLMHSYKPEWFTNQVSFVVGLTVGIIAFSPPVYHHLLRRREVYTLTKHKLDMPYRLLRKWFLSLAAIACLIASPFSIRGQQSAAAGNPQVIAVTTERPLTDLLPDKLAGIKATGNVKQVTAETLAELIGDQAMVYREYYVTRAASRQYGAARVDVFASAHPFGGFGLLTFYGGTSHTTADAIGAGSARTHHALVRR